MFMDGQASGQREVNSSELSIDSRPVEAVGHIHDDMGCAPVDRHTMAHFHTSLLTSSTKPRTAAKVHDALGLGAFAASAAPHQLASGSSKGAGEVEHGTASSVLAPSSKARSP